MKFGEGIIHGSSPTPSSSPQPPPPPGDESESENLVQDTGSTGSNEVNSNSRQSSPETIFYFEYLKRAHEALLMADGPTPNPNNTLCKNTPDAEGINAGSSKSKERIIRGNDALPNEFPWQVSIQDRKGHVCGGSLVDSLHVMTAAHCFMSVAPIPLTTIRVILGDLNLNTTSEVVHQEAGIHSLLFHAHFDPYYLTHDIAVIRLKSPVSFRPGIQPVCLPDQGNSYAGKQSVISGWGAVAYPMGRLATHLQRLENQVIENSECKRILKIDYIFSSMICGMGPKCAGTCFGDSGGPLVEEEPGGPSRVIGVVSFGIGGCALFPYWPDVYTRVSEYLDWLSYATAIL